MRTVIERRDQWSIALGDEPAANFLRAGQFAIVCVEFLMQNEKAANLRARHHLFLREGAVHLGNIFRHHVVDQRMPRQLLVGTVGDVVTFGPVRHSGRVDIENGANELPGVAVSDRFLDVGKELQSVLKILRRKHRAVGQPTDILRTIDDLQMSCLLVEETGIAGLDVTVRRHGLRGLRLILEISDKHAG